MRNEIIKIDYAKVDNLESEVNQLIASHVVLEITKPSQEIEVVEFKKKIMIFIKEKETERKEMTAPLDLSKKRIMDKYRHPLEILEKAKNQVGDIILAWNRKVQEELRKQQEKLDRQAKAEEERKKKALEERAKTAESKGDLAKAEELREKKEEVFVQAPVVAPPPKVAGSYTKVTYKGVVIDFAAVTDEYKLINQAALDAIGTATVGKIQIKGVEWKKIETQVTRADSK